MKYIKIYVIIVLLLGRVFGASIADRLGMPEVAAEDRALRQALDKIEEDLKDKYGIFITCFGESGTEKELKKINIGFSGWHCLNHEEARHMAVDCVRDILDIINSSESLRPMLSNVPFGPENLMFLLIFYSEQYNSPLDPYVATVVIDQGAVEYGFDVEGQEFGHARTVEESFEEAVAILGSRSCDRGALPTGV